MDKKAKKRLDIINKKLQTLRPRLACSREQADDALALLAQMSTEWKYSANTLVTPCAPWYA